MKYIQLASGDKTRDYSEVMFRFGVAMVGSGDPGRLSDETRLVFKERKEWYKLSWLDEVQEGDRIVLHPSRREIIAVGEVISKNDSVYQYSNTFADIDGWDLQHFVYVKWKSIELSFDGIVLSRRTVDPLDKDEVVSLIDEQWDSAMLIHPSHGISVEQPDLLTQDGIENHLIAKGMRIVDAENTVRTLSQVRKLANWYLSKGDEFPSSEHEIRAFLVLPLLFALGWSHQQVSVEYSHMDILLFNDHERKEPRILVETKSLFSGSHYAHEQAKNYLITKAKVLEGVRKVIITDGLTYWLYMADSMDSPHAYFSLRTFKTLNPAYPEVKGALEFIENLLPFTSHT